MKITAGALGQGLPLRDLWVSRQHRMLVSSPICERMFGQHDVLLPAIRLCDLPGIYLDTAREEMSYYHLVFDEHEVIYAEGAPSESFYPGPEALKSLDKTARAEFDALFSDASLELQMARFQPSPAKQRQLVERHVKNNQPLLA